MSLSPQFQQPENLTKDRLKQELRKSGVSFDQNENKDYYVRLYRNKILRGGGSRPRSEFSSDEEAVRRSPRSWGKKQLSKRASQESYTQMVVSMSDEELAEQMRAFGEEAGPIIDTTRGVYQRKLAKLMAERAKAASSVREADVTDYATDQMGEWSSQSSEGEGEEGEEEEAGEIDEEEEAEEEEEEVGAGQEPPVSMRLRSRTSAVSSQTRSSGKGSRVAYVSYSTPTHHVESSYLLEKPQEKQQDKQAKPQPPQPAVRDPPRKTKPPRAPAPQSSNPPSSSAASTSVCSFGFVLSFFFLVVMFAATFFVYDYYFNSGYFLSQGLDYLKEVGLLKQD